MACTLAAALHPAAPDAIHGNLLTAGTADDASADEALGIAAHWHAATQDVDFERKLLLRALLSSLPSGVLVLPNGCASLDEIDLSPLKVQTLLDALRQRQTCDLSSAAFRWDARQPPPTLAGLTHLPFAGLTKRQLDVAAYEALLLSVGAATSARNASSSTVRVVAAQLGIGSRQHRKLESAMGLSPEATAAAAVVRVARRPVRRWLLPQPAQRAGELHLALNLEPLRRDRLECGELAVDEEGKVVGRYLGF